MALIEKPIGKEYAGPSGIGRESPWLTSEDLIEGRDQKAMIEKVILYPEITFEMGRKERNKLALRFKGKERELVLNATNRKMLNMMFTNQTKAWVGKEIVLYVAQTQMKGDTVNCVRIRKERARAATAAEEFLHDEPEAPEPAVTAASEVVANGAGDGLDRESYGRQVMGEIERSGIVNPQDAQATYDRRMADYDAAHPAA